MIPYPESFGGLEPMLSRKLRKLVGRLLGELRMHNYDLMVSNDLAELEDFRVEQPEFSTISTAFDVRFHSGRDAMAQGLFLIKDGRRVGTVWRRIVSLRNRRTREALNLKRSFEELHVFYDDPLDAPRRETCVLDNNIAEFVIREGHYCYCGAAWLQREHEHVGLFKIVADLALVLCVTTAEQWDWFVACVTEDHREMAIRAFPYMNFTRDMSYCGEPLWLCTTAYSEALKMVLRAADE